MGPETDRGPLAPLPLRCKSYNPSSNWTVAWSLIRTPGLSSTTSSFLFKLLHLLLPTQERIRRIRLNTEQESGLCVLCETQVDDLEHSFFACPHTAAAGLQTLGWAQSVVPDLTPLQALRLDIGEAQLGREEGLIFTTIIGTGLKFIWEARVNKKRVEPYEVRAEMEALISILRRSRYSNEGDMLSNIVSNFNN